ncbi:hypothetical protein SAMN05216469_104202 [Ruminococcus albus]|uniref:Uncharacterized protein n=1 Tax=Ruminococcus albus TaxID=1264 RepID=A0A1H7J5U2_RUMAL|nr:hypothetical protein SAMN05216469_104202 [Ruminococcus albus]
MADRVLVSFLSYNFINALTNHENIIFVSLNGNSENIQNLKVVLINYHFNTIHRSTKQKRFQNRKSNVFVGIYGIAALILIGYNSYSRIYNKIPIDKRYKLCYSYLQKTKYCRKILRKFFENRKYFVSISIGRGR